MITHHTYKHPESAAKDKPQTAVSMGRGTVVVTTVYTPDGQRAIYLSQSEPGQVGGSADHLPLAAPDVVLDFSEATRVGAIDSLEVLIDACTRLRDALRNPERRSA